MSTEPRNPPGTGLNFIKKTIELEIMVPEGFDLTVTETGQFPNIVELSTTVNVLTDVIKISVSGNLLLKKIETSK